MGVSFTIMKLFQSLSGFQVRCNVFAVFPSVSSTNGFNPCRVFKSAATMREMPRLRKEKWFQSLSGFQVRCNHIYLNRPMTEKNCFNPCRVFKSAATVSSPSPNSNPPLVSIPVGFSSPLQLTNNDAYGGLIWVSFNPCRVFKSAATKSFKIALETPRRFQSLSGFQVRCNVQNGLPGQGPTAVSIPVGFSSPLQQYANVRHGRHRRGFNPCRVFKSAATAILQAISDN